MRSKLNHDFSSYDLFMKILARGSGFCARVTLSTWNVAKELVNSGQKEIVVDILPGNDLKRMYKKQGLNIN